MNAVTKEIMALLKVDAETAKKVHFEMMANGFDFSEASARAFKAEVKACFASMI